MAKKPAKKSEEKQLVTRSPFEEMEKMMERAFSNAWMHHPRWSFPTFEQMFKNQALQSPKVDILDRDDHVLVRAEIAGFDKKDITISATDDTVTLKGETSEETKEEKEDYFHSEISKGSFCRTLRLPSAVDGSKAKATFKDGMLEVNLPKVNKTSRHDVKID